MPLTRSQLTMVSVVAVFLTLQLLPHHNTWLFNSPFARLYLFLVALLSLVILLSTLVSTMMWLSARDAELKRYNGNWCATFSLMLAAALGTSLVNAACFRGLPMGSFAEQFDQQAWVTHGSKRRVNWDITERQKMLGDVVHRVVSAGTRDEIIAKLGPSEDDGYFSSSGREVIYCTGPQRNSFFAIDNEWLLIWFDSDGRTSRYEIRSD